MKGINNHSRVVDNNRAILTGFVQSNFGKLVIAVYEFIGAKELWIFIPIKNQKVIIPMTSYNFGNHLLRYKIRTTGSFLFITSTGSTFRKEDRGVAIPDIENWKITKNDSNSLVFHSAHLGKTMSFFDPDGFMESGIKISI